MYYVYISVVSLQLRISLFRFRTCDNKTLLTLEVVQRQIYTLQTLEHDQPLLVGQLDMIRAPFKNWKIIYA